MVLVEEETSLAVESETTMVVEEKAKAG